MIEEQKPKRKQKKTSIYTANWRHKYGLGQLNISLPKEIKCQFDEMILAAEWTAVEFLMWAMKRFEQEKKK